MESNRAGACTPGWAQTLMGGVGADVALPQECQMSPGLHSITSGTGLPHIWADVLLSAQEHGQPGRNVTHPQNSRVLTVSPHCSALLSLLRTGVAESGNFLIV